MLNWKKYQQNISREFRDLGFGSRVGRESRYRLLNRDGSFNVRREGLSFWESMTLYQVMLRISWPKFFLVTLGSYLLVNGLFAAGYLLFGPDAIAGTQVTGVESPFLNAFFFSVQAFTTVGFGQLTPIGLGANILFTIESFVGLLGFALVTGFMFARFSRPHAKIAFSEKAVVAPYQEGRALMFRIANKRRGQLMELSAKVIFSFMEDGRRVYEELPLERDSVTFFPLNWTIVHPITEGSPLRDKKPGTLRKKDAEILILLTGYAETFSQTVHTRSSYKYSEIAWGARFSNIFNVRDDGRLSINMEQISDFEEVDLDGAG
ncbi:ion channel [Fodinibius sediminis]|uniref:Inward rectifier potassium channel n=1 Tax=Fodinibius sediminis TaxID=1214077 RepID=A0A521BYC5_9BACT|nr:ion channel [Fodinibius sediminis]SMO51490.1 inward rectifier potassium channel [Fodinibius sediminis]